MLPVYSQAIKNHLKGMPLLGSNLRSHGKSSWPILLRTRPRRMILGTAGVPVSQAGHLTKLSGSLCLQPSVSDYCGGVRGESIKNGGVGPPLVVFHITTAGSRSTCLPVIYEEKNSLELLFSNSVCLLN